MDKMVDDLLTLLKSKKGAHTVTISAHELKRDFQMKFFKWCSPLLSLPPSLNPQVDKCPQE